MKISESRIIEIINEEKDILLSNKNKRLGLQHMLREIALQSAQLHDASDKLGNVDLVDLQKIKSLAEDLDSVFYRVMNT